jgi:hypothetical protein
VCLSNIIFDNNYMVEWCLLLESIHRITKILMHVQISSIKTSALQFKATRGAKHALMYICLSKAHQETCLKNVFSYLSFIMILLLYHLQSGGISWNFNTCRGLLGNDIYAKYNGIVIYPEKGKIFSYTLD